MAEKAWIVRTVSEHQLEETLNKLEKEEGAFELHGIYPTGELGRGPGGFEDRRPTFLIVGARSPA